MKVLYSLVCDLASMREDGRLDLEGVFQELHAPGFPAQQKRLVLVATIEWSADEEGTQEFEVVLRDPEEQLLFGIEVESQVEFSQDLVPPQTRLLLPLENVIFPGPGRFQFLLKKEQDVLDLAQLYLVESE